MSHPKKKKIILGAGLLLMAGILVLSGLFYYAIFAPRVKLTDTESILLEIPSGSSFSDVRELLLEKGVVHAERSFDWLAHRKNYPARVMPGRYRIHDGMSHNGLINLLRSGQQEAVRLTFSGLRSIQELARVIAHQLEMDSLSVIELLHDEELLHELGVDRHSAKLLFIPNTYEVYWNISPPGLLRRMEREHRAFWHDKRREKASRMGMSPQEVGILASIVQSETSKRDEMARIAGVYVNRLERTIPLQADPTVIYAMGDFSIRRVLNSHLEFESPYNTYLHAGLPPGPINFPEPYTIDAVLNYERHDYLFFSAREDFSGYHVFARTYHEHLNNARRYRRALDELRVFR